MVSSRDAVRDLYDSTAESYASIMDSEIDQPFYSEVFARLVEGMSPLDGALIDTSCGSGHMLDVYQRNFEPSRDLVGIDLSSEMVAITKKRLGERAEVIVGDMTTIQDLDLEPAAGLISFFAIHHLDESQLVQAIYRWYQQLQPNGVLVLAAWEGEGNVDYGDSSSIVAKRYSMDHLISVVAKSGFQLNHHEVIEFDDFPMGAALIEATKST